MYILEGRYPNIEDTSVKSLWCFESKDDVEYYIQLMQEFIEACRERYVIYLSKHKSEEEDTYMDYELNQYMDKVARLLTRKDNVLNFWADAFVGVGYYDYCPNFRYKSIDVIKRITK